MHYSPVFSTQQVEDELYKVLREPFVSSSQVFRDMFSMPHGDERTKEGLSDEHPIVLESVQKTHFEALLQILDEDSLDCLLSFPLDLWIGVLKLARTWLMVHSHQVIHQKILMHEELRDFAHKIQVAREYNLSDLFVLACKELINRDSPPISYEEASAFGIEQSFHLLALREERFIRMGTGQPKAQSPSNIPFSCKAAEDTVVDAAVRVRLAGEIQMMNNAYNDEEND
jgi:hypothetical protein